MFSMCDKFIITKSYTTYNQGIIIEEWSVIIIGFSKYNQPIVYFDGVIKPDGYPYIQGNPLMCINNIHSFTKLKQKGQIGTIQQ